MTFSNLEMHLKVDVTQCQLKYIGTFELVARDVNYGFKQNVHIDEFSTNKTKIN